MKARLWQRPNDYNGAATVFSAMEEGIVASGHEVEYLDPLAQPITPRLMQSADVHVCYSYQYRRSNQIVESCEFNKPNRRLFPRPVIVIDSAWLYRSEYRAVGLGGINGDAEFKNAGSPPDRFENLGIEIKPWKTGGSYILIASNSKHDINLPCDRIVWAEKVVKTIQKHCPDTRIVYRPFPGDKRNPGVQGTELSINRSLEEDLAGAAALVTHTSNVVVDALLAGVPIFTTGKSVADCLAFRDLRQIGEIVMGGRASESGERERFFYNLAYAQWTLDEMRQGIPFRRLMGIESQEPVKEKPKRGRKKKDEPCIDDSSSTCGLPECDPPEAAL